ncbi:hypothetical protein [Nocardia sp. NPDC059239]|uniref:hypothetical protein n=1 Tax=unclassified Nocardia TaxID=2637762 RepID=UPI0036D18D51
MSVERSMVWTTHAPDLIVLSRAMDSALGRLMEAEPKLKRSDGYRLQTDTTTLSADDIEAAAGRVGEQPHTISWRYGDSFGSGTSVGVYLTTQLQARGKQHFSVRVTGPDKDATFGFMERVKNRLDLELGKCEAANWASVPAVPVSGLPSVPPSAEPIVRQRLSILRHPLGSTVIGGLVTTVAGVGISIYAHLHHWL